MLSCVGGVAVCAVRCVCCVAACDARCAVDVDVRFCADRRIVTGVDLRAACRVLVRAVRAVLGVAAVLASVVAAVRVAVLMCACDGTYTSCDSVSSSDEACRYLA